MEGQKEGEGIDGGIEGEGRDITRIDVEVYDIQIYEYVACRLYYV